MKNIIDLDGTDYIEYVTCTTDHKFCVVTEYCIQEESHELWSEKFDNAIALVKQQSQCRLVVLADNASIWD